MFTTESNREEQIASNRGSSIPRIEARNVSKHFPGVQALDGVTLAVNGGEIHAVTGENGAGKSTLMKLFAGMYRPDAGQILLNGEPVTFPNVATAKQRGVLLIHQELSLVPELTVAENIFLGNLPRGPLGRINWGRLHRVAAGVLEELDCQLSPTTNLGGLSIAQQQMVEIGRALALKPQLVILDEPTASLTTKEQKSLFGNLRRMRAAGIAIIYISHRMEEIFELCDRVTVLRDGKTQGTLVVGFTNEREISTRMIGRELPLYSRKPTTPVGPEIISVRQLTRQGDFEDINLAIRQGEIVGLYGLIGSGRTALAETLFGLQKADAGTILLRGQQVSITSPVQALKQGIALVPENRKEQGLVLGLGARENICLSRVHSRRTFGFIQSGAEEKIYQDFQQKLRIKTRNSSQAVLTLSGGNQQKVVFAKWLATHPKLLILDEPTRGIDIGAKAQVHDLIFDLAGNGIAVLIISSEMPEIIGLSHRILTMYRGKISGEFNRDTVTEEQVIAAITGTKEPVNKETGNRISDDISWQNFTHRH